MPNRLQRDRAILMVCDMQDNFAQETYCYEQVLKVVQSMIKSAQLLQMPILITQHLKKTLSHLIPSLKSLLQKNKYPIVVKEKFSMIVPQVEINLKQHPQKKQIILLGIQAHICVLQTFLDLKQLGYEVWIVSDAVTSLTQFQRNIGLKRLEKQGALITSYQTVIFQLLRYSYDDKFSQLCDIIKQTEEFKKHYQKRLQQQTNEKSI